MKKIIICILILLTLSGCNNGSDYIEPEDRIIVSALGYENVYDRVKLTAEYININTTDNSDSYTISVVDGTGDTIKAALKEIESQLDGKLMLSQCPVIIISRNLSSKNIGDLYDFIIDSTEIPLGIKLVENSTPQSLIKSNEDKKPMGYQIMGVLRFAEDSFDIKDNNTFTQIMNGTNQYMIPMIEMKNTVSFSGSAVFKNNVFFDENRWK